MSNTVLSHPSQGAAKDGAPEVSVIFMYGPLVEDWA